MICTAFRILKHVYSFLFSLQVAYNKLYSSSSAAEKCTMYSDRNLVNRRNVMGNVTAAANPCRRFFQIEEESRLVAAALHVLGMNNVNEKTSVQNIAPGLNATGQERKCYLRRVASAVVDQFVVDQDRNKDMRHSAQFIKHEQEASTTGVNSEGSYFCRFPGCQKTFAHNGKVRREHEANHNPPVVIVQPPTGSFILHSSVDEDKRDEMLAYQKALLDYGMLILNFWDTIKEGDGERLLRCWKFFLMYLKQGGSATKYSLEGLYLMFQYHALLSPQAAHRLMWNIFVKNTPGVGGNIPLDLQLEFFNRTFKEAIKKLGPSASSRSVDRVCHSLQTTIQLMRNFDVNLSVLKRSG